MRIHHIVNSYSVNCDGAEKIAFQLFDGAKGATTESQLVLLQGVDKDASLEKKTVGRIIILNKRPPYSIKTFINVVRYISRQCSINDIIHAHLFPTMLYVSIAVKILRWKGVAVCTEHSTYNKRRGTGFGKIVDGITYSGYKKIFCISDGVKAQLAEWLPEFSDRMIVVENGVDLQFSEFYQRKGNNKLIIVSVGRLHKLKNYESALRALSRIKNIDFEYRIAGIGNEQENLERLCMELGIANRVKFYGYVDNIAEFLKQADVFLITSLWEGFGLAVVEAMNAGLPVIASDVPGLREIVGEDRLCGRLAAPDDIAGIADAIMEFADYERRIECGNNAFMRSLKFSKERMIDAYVTEYEKVCLQPLR